MPELEQPADLFCIAAASTGLVSLIVSTCFLFLCCDDLKIPMAFWELCFLSADGRHIHIHVTVGVQRIWPGLETFSFVQANQIILLFVFLFLPPHFTS